MPSGTSLTSRSHGTMRPSTSDWNMPNTSELTCGSYVQSEPGACSTPGLICHPAPGLKPVRAREEGDAVVALLPLLQAVRGSGLRGAGLKAHEGVRKVVEGLVVLRRKVVGLRLALEPDGGCVLVALVHVVRDGAFVVEEFAEDVPAAFAVEDLLAEQGVSGDFDSLLQQKLAASLRDDVAEALIFGGIGAVCSLRGRGKPALVDAAAVRAEGVDVIRVELETAARNHERAGNPRWGKLENARAGFDRLLNLTAIQCHVPSSVNCVSLRRGDFRQNLAERRTEVGADSRA